MKKYRIEYWEESHDEQRDFDEIVEALSPESALKQFLLKHENNRLLKRGKNSITVKQINQIKL